MFVDIHGEVTVAEQELLIGESEHAQGSLVFDMLRDVLYVLGFELWNRPGLLFVQGENFEAAGCADCEAGVEEVHACAFGGDVEFVVFAEEFCCLIFCVVSMLSC